MTTAVLAQGVNIEEYFNPPFASFGELISTLLPNLFILAGVILLFLLLGGGFAFIINAGKGQQEGAAKSGKVITAALIGFLIIIGSYWLIQIISTITGLNILNPPGFGS
jgi:hypothetical protein